MFRFLFKRKTGKSAAAAHATHAAHSLLPVAADAAARRSEQMALAKAVAGDEAAAVEFILRCDLADVRLVAAENVHAPLMLERVYQALRNTDRRVAKLMRGRLDAIKHEQAQQKLAQTCIETAQRLLQDENLTPNQVAQLDRLWQGVVAAPELAQSFGAARTGLTQRLEAQVQLQRAVIDALAALRRLGSAALPHGELAQTLQCLSDEHALHVAAPEHGVLPKQLLADVERELAQARSTLFTLEKHQAAFDARQAALTEWQGADPASLNAGELTRSWQNLPDLPTDNLTTRLQEDFDALIGTIPALRTVPPARRAAPAADQQFLDTLEAMDSALQQGLLHSAYEHDKTLRDSKGARLTAAQSERLSNLRAELKRLGDWARWGGNVSREELVKAVEELPAQGLSLNELPKKVGSMRERWKALDGLSGPSPKVLWERFDAACTTAYAPAAAHFKQLANERQANADQARALIARAIAHASEAPASEEGAHADWKPIAGLVQRLHQSWDRLGTIERKDKKRLDLEFGHALHALEAPLTQQRQDEMARRDKLIAEVEALNPNERGTVDALRRLQERWQLQAKSLPLERNAEQALWKRFRAACDGVFAKRKESAGAADLERRAHLGAKEALCAQLEMAAAAQGAPSAAAAAAIGKLLRETDTAWNGAGEVPRADQQKLEQRYQGAVAALRAQRDASKRNAHTVHVEALREKLRLCQALESALDHAQTPKQDWSALWRALPALAGDYEASLYSRFCAAQAALTSSPNGYLERLEQNRARLLQEVLRLEIVAGVDSGAQFSRERLKLQVEGLQSSLRSGQKPLVQEGGLLALCTLPALADAPTMARIEQLFKRIGSAGAELL